MFIEVEVIGNAISWSVNGRRIDSGSFKTFKRTGDLIEVTGFNGKSGENVDMVIVFNIFTSF
jgi:hypothetical protein